MVNWEETDEELPRQTESGQTYTEHQVSFDQTSPLIPVVYEDQGERELMSTLGEWLFLRDKEKSTKDEAFYLSNDNIYFAKIELPYCTINHDGRKHLDQYGNLDGFIYQDQCLNIIHPGEIRRLSINCIYEYNDNIIIDATSGLHVGKLLRLTVPKADILIKRWYNQAESNFSAVVPPFLC